MQIQKQGQSTAGKTPALLFAMHKKLPQYHRDMPVVTYTMYYCYVHAWICLNLAIYIQPCLFLLKIVLGFWPTGRLYPELEWKCLPIPSSLALTSSVEAWHEQRRGTFPSQISAPAFP
mmetsp:Transcript_103572/g.200693  ORF Transcript_103572/g.200693 Transcript_103572/m.200693 type:complete len:118 (+) Transcript_103572:302-655(+)